MGIYPHLNYTGVVSQGGLRSDAARNRLRLIAAARVVLAERGLHAPLDEIARRAEVGNATLYRHFPSRCDLVAAVFADTLRQVVATAEIGLADPDPWHGFAQHMEFLCRVQAGNRALADLLIARVEGSPELEALRCRAHDRLNRIIRRAQSAGQLRSEFRHRDVVLVLMANAGLIERTGLHAPNSWRRHLSFVLEGLRADATTAVIPSPPSERSVGAAMAGLAERMGLHGSTG